MKKHFAGPMRSALVLSACAGAWGASQGQASTVIPHNFNEYGTNVNGYQDYFTGTNSSSLAGNYTQIASGSAVPAGSTTAFTLPGDGTLHMNAASGDPNKLLYSGATYSSTNQNILAMIQVTGGTNNDGFRGGVASTSSSTSGQGVNALFRQQGNGGDPGGNLGNHVNFLNDGLAWGPTVGGANSWATNTYYWLRLTTDGSTQTGELWPADGTTPESSALTGTWNATGRSGLAGLATDSGGDGTFQVNYLLIQTPDLPSITAGAVPEPASLSLLGLGALGLLARRRAVVA